MNRLLLFCFSIVFTITSSFLFGQAPVIDSVISSPQVCTGTSTGASITIYAQGTGNSYFLTGPVNTIPQSGNMFSDIPSGTYSVTVANSFGSVQEAGIIIYDQSSALQLPTLQTQETSCIGGSDGYVVVSANGGQAPYNFVINSGPVQPPFLNSNGVDTIFGLSASIIYNIEVTDACGQQINLGFEIEYKNLVNLPLPSGNVMWPAGSSSNNCDSVALFYLPATPSNTENRQAYPLTFNFVSLDLLHPNITVIHDVFPNQLQQVYLAQGDWRYIVEDACGRIDSVDFSVVNQQMIVQTNAAASSGSCSP